MSIKNYRDKESYYFGVIGKFIAGVKRALNALVDLFFDRECAVCGRELLLNEDHLCLNCYAELPLTYFWNYRNHAAEQVFWGRVRVERVYSLYYYINRYRAPIHKLKYKSNVEIGLYLGRMLGEKIALEESRFDFIVPIPLHWRKLQKRGYNQSKVIARGIKEGLRRGREEGRVEICNLIKRQTFTNTQTEKDRIERWKNVAAAFAINSRAVERVKREWLLREKRHRDGEKIYQHKIDEQDKLPPCRILLVDDVLTTGATLEVCASLIKEHLDAEIYIATLAYVE